MGIWQHSGSLDSIFALQQGGPDWSPACSSWNPKTFSSGELESPTDVNVSVNVCQIVCVSSVRDWQPVHGVLCLSPTTNVRGRGRSLTWRHMEYITA